MSENLFVSDRMLYIRYTCSQPGIHVLNVHTQAQCKSYYNDPGHILNRFPKLTHHKFGGKRICVQQLSGMWVYVTTAVNCATSKHALLNSATLLHHKYTLNGKHTTRFMKPWQKTAYQGYLQHVNSFRVDYDIDNNLLFANDNESVSN